MLGLSIKILLAAFAFCLAVLQVSGRESLSKDKSKILPSRLTRAGWTRITLAAATLLLISLNELVGYRETQADTIRARATQETLQTELARAAEDLATANQRLEDSQAGVAILVNEVANLRQGNEFLQRSLDGTFVLSESFGVPLYALPADTQLWVPNVAGKSVSIEKGDTIEWSFECPGGVAPSPDLLTGHCALDGYGAFQAYADRVILSQLSGKKTLRGTASNDGEFLFHTACPRIHEALVKSSCEVDVSVMTQARTRFRQIEENESGNAPLNLTPNARAACRTYEALYGESCEQAVERLRR